MNMLNFEFKASQKPEVKGLPKTIEGLAYSGAVIPKHGALGDVVVDLDGIKIPEKLLLLADHDHKERIGLGRVRKSGNSLLLTANLLLNDETLSLRQQLSAGLPIGLSIGVQGEIERSGKAITVNGRFIKADTIIRKAKLMEVSIVSFGADSDAMITAAFSSKNRERELFMFLFNQVANPPMIEEKQADDSLKHSEAENLAMLLFTQVANIHHSVHG